MRQNRMTRNERKRELLKQKLLGLAMLACLVLLTWMERDGTAAVLLAPLALYVIFTKDVVIC